MPGTTALVLSSLSAGALWGGVAWLLGAKALGTPVWAGVLASPWIGWLVAHLTHERFCATGGLGRTLWSLASLYLGAIAFGIACGVGALLARSTSSHVEVFLEPLLSVLWGVTFTGFFLFLAPVTYLTHWWLERQLVD